MSCVASKDIKVDEKKNVNELKVHFFVVLKVRPPYRHCVVAVASHLCGLY
jgi:hypothetical protein